jgi:hypothetical protein
MTWEAPTIANWTCIEVHVAIICACLTTLKPFLTRFFPKILGSRTSNSREGWEENPGVLDGYQRPLTVGSKPSRGNFRERGRESWVSETGLGGTWLSGPQRDFDKKRSSVEDDLGLPIYSNVSDRDVSPALKRQAEGGNYGLNDLEAQRSAGALLPLYDEAQGPAIPARARIQQRQSYESTKRYEPEPNLTHNYRGL